MVRFSFISPRTLSCQFRFSSSKMQLLSSPLWPAVKRQTELAERAGALKPFSTETHVINDAGLSFFCLVVKNLAAKPVAAPPTEKVAKSTSVVNPFLPHEEALFIGNLSGAHKLLLNKFNVQPHHVLVCTQNFENQTDPLNAVDWAATWFCVCELDGLGFYNFGVHSGRSQPHKHMQVIPLPFVAGSSPTPLDKAIENASNSTSAPVFHIPEFRFAHAICLPPKALLQAATFPPDSQICGNLLMETYQKLLEFVGIPLAPADEEGTISYNVLITKRWIMLVPRARESIIDNSISLNSVAFAGSVLLKDATLLERVRKEGPLRLLEQVTRPL